MLNLDILFQDEHYVAIQKPSGLFAHPSEMNPNEPSAMMLLRNQVGKWVYPVHRLDRATSGVMLFALSSDAAKQASILFAERKVKKTYYAVLRGYTTESGVIDHPLKKDGVGDLQESQTGFRLLKKMEVPIANKRFPCSRYSLVEAIPHTGRMHQIRRHFVHLRNPIVGDTTYGDGAHNKIFRQHYGLDHLLLFAVGLELEHPYEKSVMSLNHKEPESYIKVLNIFEQSQV